MLIRWLGNLAVLLASIAACIIVVAAGGWWWFWSTNERELQALLIAAEAGDAASQFALGRSFENGSILGVGPTRDISVAVDWYSRAAQAGSGRAHLRLGLLHYEGATGIERDYSRALEHFESASFLGEPDGGYWLATMHRSGEGVPADQETALELLREAAEEGSTLGMQTLSFAYELGTFGLSPDPQSASEWRARAEASRKRETEAIASKLSRRLFHRDQ